MWKFNLRFDNKLTSILPAWAVFVQIILSSGLARQKRGLYLINLRHHRMSRESALVF